MALIIIHNISDLLWRNREQVASQMFLALLVQVYDQVYYTLCIQPHTMLTISMSSLTKSHAYNIMGVTLSIEALHEFIDCLKTKDLN